MTDTDLDSSPATVGGEAERSAPQAKRRTKRAEGSPNDGPATSGARAEPFRTHPKELTSGAELSVASPGVDPRPREQESLAGLEWKGGAPVDGAPIAVSETATPPGSAPPTDVEGPSDAEPAQLPQVADLVGQVPVSPVPALPDAAVRSSALVDVGVEIEVSTREKAVFSLAATKRRDGMSFLGDFSTALLEHAASSQAQLFQDVFAAFIAREAPGFFVEVGTGDGKLISNTYLLEQEFGWSGLVVEPNPTFLPALRQNRGCRISTDCVYDVTGRTVTFMCTADPEFSRIVDGHHDLHDQRRAEQFSEITLTTVSLNDLLRKHDCPQKIGYLSLDVEGSEFDILQTFDFNRWTVDCITVEHNWTGDREKIFDLLTSHGFIRVFEHLSQWDDWYVQREVLAGFPTARHLALDDGDLTDPRDSGKYLGWALEALERGEPDIAETLCLRAIELDDSSAVAHRTLAEIATRRRRRRLALERWRTAVGKAPSDYWARIGLAEMLASSGAIAEAVANLREAVVLNPDPERARSMLAELEPKLAARSG